MRARQCNERGRTAARSQRPGALPPDFGFGDGSTYYTLRQMKGNKSVLLVFCLKEAGDCLEGMRSVRDEWKEFHNRDMLVITIIPGRNDRFVNQVRSEHAPIVLIEDQGRKTLASYGIPAQSDTVVYLIGKDGLIKQMWSRWPPNQEIFQKVDALREINERNAA